MHFEQHAAFFRLERTVNRPGRPARVGVRLEGSAAIALGIVAYGQIAGELVDLLPVFVDEGLRGEYAGRETQQAGAAAALVHLVQGAGEYLLVDAGGIAGGHFPSGAEINGMKFIVFLVDGHVVSFDEEWGGMGDRPRFPVMFSRLEKRGLSPISYSSLVCPLFLYLKHLNDIINHC